MMDGWYVDPASVHATFVIFFIICFINYLLGLFVDQINVYIYKDNMDSVVIKKIILTHLLGLMKVV